MKWLFGNGINYILTGEPALSLLCIADMCLYHRWGRCVCVCVYVFFWWRARSGV